MSSPPREIDRVGDVPVRRVLMTGDAVGGVWTYALELAGALRQRGIEVLLAIMGSSPSAEQRVEAARVDNLRLVCGDFDLEWMDDPWDDVRRAGDWLLDVETRWHPDVVHLNGYAHGALPWRAPVLMVGHSCVCSWWQAVLNEPAPARWNRYREEVACGLAAAGTIVAPSRAMLAALEEHYGPLPPGRVEVIPNGRTASLFSPGVKQPIVMTAGRLWDLAKNLAAIAAVAPWVDWPIYAAGPASRDHAPQRTAEGGDRGVRFLGTLTHAQLARWFASASIFVLPARYEPFGLSALEAALAGCALVLGDIPSLREIWGDAAVFVPPDDDVALGTVLRDLMADEDRRTRLAAAARARAWEYSPARMAHGYLAAYSSLRRHTLPADVPSTVRSVAEDCPRHPGPRVGPHAG